MPTIRELFSKKVKGLTKGLYEGSKIYIESQGAINPPRLKALALASPNGVADLIGISAAAALGIPIGYANRPSDTIFGNPGPFAKPLIGLAGPLAQRRTGIVNPTKAYYIKQTPAPYQQINQIKNGISTNPLGTLITAAKNELRDGTLAEIFAKRKDVKDKFGSKYQHLGTRSKPLITDTKFSENVPNYSGKKTLPGLAGALQAVFGESNQGAGLSQTSVAPRKNSKIANGVSKWDQINNALLTGQYKEISNLEKGNKGVNIPYVAFEIYGKTGADAHILLPGTISGLSEDLEPTWNTYKYVGSPFNTYRYSGVERSIKFDLKLYANGKESLKNLKKNLDKLRETTFPDKEITEIKYGGKPIFNGFNPNLIYLTISGYYKKLFGFIDGLSISVDDDVPWPTTDEEFDGIKDTPYPAVILVSISMKIIEVVTVATDKGKKVLRYNFTEVRDGQITQPTNQGQINTPAGVLGGAIQAAQEAQANVLQKVGKLFNLGKG